MRCVLWGQAGRSSGRHGMMQQNPLLVKRVVGLLAVMALVGGLACSVSDRVSGRPPGPSGLYVSLVEDEDGRVPFISYGWEGQDALELGGYEVQHRYAKEAPYRNAYCEKSGEVVEGGGVVDGDDRYCEVPMQDFFQFRVRVQDFSTNSRWVYSRWLESTGFDHAPP